MKERFIVLLILVALLFGSSGFLVGLKVKDDEVDTFSLVREGYISGVIAYSKNIEFMCIDGEGLFVKQGPVVIMTGNKTIEDAQMLYRMEGWLEKNLGNSYNVTFNKSFSELNGGTYRKIDGFNRFFEHYGEEITRITVESKDGTKSITEWNY